MSLFVFTRICAIQKGIGFIGNFAFAELLEKKFGLNLPKAKLSEHAVLRSALIKE